MSNAEKAVPDLTLTLGGKTFNFKINLRGLRRVEEKASINLFKSINWTSLGFKDLSLLFWVGLLGDKDCNLSQDESDELLDIVGAAENFRALTAFIEGAVERAIPNLSEEDAKALTEQKKKVTEALRQMPTTPETIA